MIGIPSTKSPKFEQWYFELNQSLYDTSEMVGKIMRDMTDDDIIYQKGEGPELVNEVNGTLIPRKGAVLMSKYFVARRVELVRQAMSDWDQKTVLDVGASSDLLFRYLEKTGTGLNISERAVEHMKSHGIDAIVGDAHNLPYPDNSFDCVLCYQTIEHLDSPLLCLRELGRVARERVFLTIPHQRKTKVCGFQPKDREQHRWHFLEFSVADFKKALARAGLNVRHHEIIRGAGPPRSIKQNLFALRNRRHSWFRGFAHFELDPPSAS